MIIGNFTRYDDGYAGSIYGIGFGLPYVTFSPVPAKQDNGPDFLVITRPPIDNADYEFGAAWAKTSKAGKPYLSVKLDGPMLAQPINCALIKQPNGSQALVWTRKDSAADEQSALAEAEA